MNAKGVKPVLAAVLAALMYCSGVTADTALPDYGVPDARSSYALHKGIIEDKLSRALLPAMRRHGIDLWLVLDREYNPDPLHAELGGIGLGVRAAYLFFDSGGERPEALYFGSHEQPANSVIASVYDHKHYYGYSAEGLTPHLQRAVRERNPKRIAINRSQTIPMADGLTAGLLDYLSETLGPEFSARFVSSELLVRDFRLQRTERETAVYQDLLRWSERWMQEALSAAVVTPGETTAADIAWWLKDRASSQGLDGSATVRVVREGTLLPVHDPDMAIEPGDILNIDGGLSYLGYWVDIKRTAYVLKPDEQALPASLQAAWDAAQRVAAIYTSRMRPGSIGHEIWSAINAEVAALGYTTVGPDAGGDAADDKRPEVGVYGHSVGNGMHDIGARIAADLPFAYGNRVRYPLQSQEWVSIEFHVSTPVPEWDGKTWYTRFEETGQVSEAGLRWLLPPQQAVFLIQPLTMQTPNSPNS
jgi:Xaa-Pro aminopeptidase